MPTPVKRQENEDPSTVAITVKGQDGNETFFTIKRQAPMKKLLICYCNKKSLEYKAMRFLIDGSRFSHAKTPAQLGLENGDQIDALMLMVGGGRVMTSDSIII